jgi:hypothetical protein
MKEEDDIKQEAVAALLKASAKAAAVASAAAGGPDWGDSLPTFTQMMTALKDHPKWTPEAGACSHFSGGEKRQLTEHIRKVRGDKDFVGFAAKKNKAKPKPKPKPAPKSKPAPKTKSAPKANTDTDDPNKA